MFGLDSALRRFDPAAGLRLRLLPALCEVNAGAFWRADTATSSDGAKVGDISLCAGDRHGVSTTSASGQKRKIRTCPLHVCFTPKPDDLERRSECL
jgi:hypothetical protein